MFASSASRNTYLELLYFHSFIFWVVWELVCTRIRCRKQRNNQRPVYFSLHIILIRLATKTVRHRGTYSADSDMVAYPHLYLWWKLITVKDDIGDATSDTIPLKARTSKQSWCVYFWNAKARLLKKTDPNYGDTGTSSPDFNYVRRWIRETVILIHLSSLCKVVVTKVTLFDQIWWVLIMLIKHKWKVCLGERFSELLPYFLDSKLQFKIYVIYKK